MKAMILAAGRGERLRPLTDHTPKPLIPVAGKPLIQYHIENLKQAGITDIVINTAWLAEQIHDALGNGDALDVSIQYSDEGSALETAGGIIKALPMLGEEPFVVINGDIWCDYPLTSLPSLEHDDLAHLVLVDNPEHNADGDFALNNRHVSNKGTAMLTFSGIGLYRKELFDGCPVGPLPLAPILRQHCDLDRIAGSHYPGRWTDVGTIERLQHIERYLKTAEAERN
jgi:N-acetyl-alpha-D-muramate 1-phosphate uridylyltransferase